MKKTMKTLGQILTIAREDAKLTQEKLAKKLKISTSYLNSIEVDRPNYLISKRLLIEIPKALGLAQDLSLEYAAHAAINRQFLADRKARHEREAKAKAKKSTKNPAQEGIDAARADAAKADSKAKSKATKKKNKDIGKAQVAIQTEKTETVGTIPGSGSEIMARVLAGEISFEQAAKLAQDLVKTPYKAG
jgi:cytoskeletal protein RodZ